MDIDTIVHNVQIFLTFYFVTEVIQKMLGFKDHVGGPLKKKGA